MAEKQQEEVMIVISENNFEEADRRITQNQTEVSVEAPGHQIETLHSTRRQGGQITTAVALLKHTLRVAMGTQYQPQDVVVAAPIGTNSGRRMHGVVQPCNLPLR